MLNLIKQAIHYAMTEILDQRLKPDRCRPAFVKKDLLSNIRDRYKDWRPEEIEFFDPNCEESSLVIIPNCYSYYPDVYAFIDRLKKIAIL